MEVLRALDRPQDYDEVLQPPGCRNLLPQGLAYRELGKAVEQMRDWYKAGQLGFDPS